MDLFASLEDQLIAVLEDVESLLLFQSLQVLLDVLLTERLLHLRHFVGSVTLHLFD